MQNGSPSSTRKSTLMCCHIRDSTMVYYDVVYYLLVTNLPQFAGIYGGSFENRVNFIETVRL